jgi:long-chain acyl-CoA synthetase
MEVKIDSKDPLHEVGEILARGENVMLGYYKNPEATAEALDSEGWYHTGDLGLMDKKGNVFIKGRSKNMLLGASGQNIYPEEIEDKLNNMPFVLESVVIQRDEKLYALIVADVDAAKANGIEGKEAILEQMEKNRKEINNLLANYEKLAGVKLMDEEFEKTPKKSIKRYLYTNVEI